MTDVVVNPLLDRIKLPGETFRLPSQGVFYTNGELSSDVQNGEVEVYPMTAIDEVVLSTPDKLLSGKAIAEVFGRCVPQIKKPMDLLTQDVDFLMICLRYVSFGPTMSVNYKHTCENAHDNTYEVDLMGVIKATKQIDPTKVKTDYEVKLPNGQIAFLKPPTFSNIIGLYETTLMAKKNVKEEEEISDEEMTNIVVGALSGIVCRVDDITNHDHIVEWLKQLPLGWKQVLQKAAQNVSKWGVEVQVQRPCADCGETFEISVSTNPVSFFF